MSSSAFPWAKQAAPEWQAESPPQAQAQPQETTEMRSLLSSLLIALLISGCTVGPDYKRPSAVVPTEFRAVSPEASKAEAASLGDQKWWDVFRDDQLQSLIRTAIQQNYDVRIAATRVLEAQAQLGITRSNQFPSVSGGANLSAQRTSQSIIFPAIEQSTGQLNLSAAWQLDFWGQYRRATEAARASLLSTEWGRRAVISSLVSSVASAYFQLRALDLQLELSENALTARRESLRLTSVLADHGNTSELDVRQAEQLVYTASEEIPDLERLIQQQENLLSTLLGNNPGPITRGLALTEQPHPPEVPAGIPSELLERRPDIRQSEQVLIAANAQIGVARAAYYPQIALTTSGGFQSDALARLFGGPAGLWSFAGYLVQPIFTAGRIRSGVRLAEAEQQEAVLSYQQTIQQSFREVSDALIGYRKLREFREQQELLTASAEGAAHLSNIRYKGGVTSYLEVLTNETNYFSAELNLAQAQANELLALVQLYQALGGGWQQ
jgi:multidrug efflux system outer membrane protein